MSKLLLNLEFKSSIIMKQFMTSVLVIIFIFSTTLSNAQMPIQIFGGDKSIEYQFMWLKALDKKQKVSLFNFSYFNVDYKSKEKNTYEIYQVASYNLTKNFGLSGGGRFFNNEFTPLLAINYQATAKDFYISAFPSVQYSLSAKELYYSLFCIAVFTPSFNNTWGMYNQVFFEPLFNKNQHLFSYQQLRIGLDYKKQFQFGIGANLTQIGKTFEYGGNYGLFIRTDLK